MPAVKRSYFIWSAMANELERGNGCIGKQKETTTNMVETANRNYESGDATNGDTQTDSAAAATEEKLVR